MERVRGAYVRRSRIVRELAKLLAGGVVRLIDLTFIT